MIVARGFEELTDSGPSVVTVGTFDGVHLGHRMILDRVIQRSKETAARSLVVTFDPHPRTVVGRGDVPLLSTLPERLALIGECGIQAAVILAFTFEFSRQTPEEFFLRAIVDGAHAREIVIGYDHMFGRDRTAGTDHLRQLAQSHGIATSVVDPVKRGTDILSSSAIRKLLLAGAVETAAEYLGRPYRISGIVIAGDARGRVIGFPTANLAAEDLFKVVPGNGVYLVGVSLGAKRLYGMMNIGTRPTFSSAAERTLEVHIFDFAETLYGKELQIHFLRRLRDEKKFTSQEELVRQLASDSAASKKLLAELFSSHIIKG
jgi:riboflavin kinase/FMN adenylyltransferase